MAVASPGPAAPSPREPAARPRGQWLTIALLLLAVAGIVVSVELIHVHYKVNTDPDFVSFCNIGEAVNCETVAASPYSELFGVPVAVWSIFAYFVLFGLGLAGTRRVGGAPAGFPGLILFWTIVAVLWTLAMAIISATLIASLCILCGALYVVNTLLLVLAIVRARMLAGGVKRAIKKDMRRILGAPVMSAAICAFLGALVVGLILWYPDVRASANVVPDVSPAPEADQCGAGHTAEGFPLFGAAEGVVTIEEFSCYECGHCRRAHDTLRKLVHEFHDNVRLVHRHYPLDNACNPQVPRPFHRHGCLSARAAVCADHEGKFWEMNDRLFANQRNIADGTVRRWAEEIGLDMPAFEACLTDPKTDAEILRDIRDGVGWGVRGTPSFVINGEFVKGARNEAGFRALIEKALARCTDAAPAPAPAGR